jgi:NAD(P)-dependent dehydrogenase (short-subunit alcohol dehydrogenase family)
MQSVVITGASTGIGWATAKLLFDRGFRVFGSVRKQADADRLKSEFGANFTPLLFDVTNEAAVLAAAREVRTALNGETLAGSSTTPALRSQARCSSSRPTNSVIRWMST